MSKIKTRFAPSPTGFLHIGSLRTALYNYLFAKQHQGKFLLRIEDTDQSRSVKNADKQLISVLSKMGLNYDEGPIMGRGTQISEKGQTGPYFQSKRLKIYQEYAKILVEQDKAYYCFCSAERLDKLRTEQQLNKQAPKYDGCCKKLTENEKIQKLQSRSPYVIRLKVPKQGSVKFNDLIRGSVEIKNEEIDEQVLIKSDGFPTY